MSREVSEEGVGALIGTGTWRDWLPRAPAPVFAFGTRDLYLALVHGSGFTLPIRGGSPAIGFIKNAVVAARDVREAEELAKGAVLRDWRRKGLQRSAGADPVLEVDELSVLPERFRFRSRTGFAFYSEAESS